MCVRVCVCVRTYVRLRSSVRALVRSCGVCVCVRCARARMRRESVRACLWCVRACVFVCRACSRVCVHVCACKFHINLALALVVVQTNNCMAVACRSTVTIDIGVAYFGCNAKSCLQVDSFSSDHSTTIIAPLAA